ncbi:MAG: Ig-like domain-containing protein [Thermodesulfobacteriota bacterium]
MITEFKNLCVVALLVFSLCQGASAELAAVGPVNSTNGFPSWYTDENGVALQLCLDPVNCSFDAPIIGNLFSQQIGFGEKAFYWSASAQLAVGPGGSGTAILNIALEASFSGSVTGVIPADGEQITFSEISIGPINNLVPGEVYTVTHPFGVLAQLVADALGVIAQQKQDIGCAAAPCGDFAAVLASGIGPFLKWDPAVTPAPPAGFIGNPAVAHKVIGSPFSTNFFRIEGANVGGTGVHLIQTDLFDVQGMLFAGAVPTPVAINQSTYTRPLPNAVNVFATSTSSATLRVSGPGITSKPMVGNGAGRFFAHIGFADTPPSFITVTASDPPNTPTTATSNVVDVITITLAEYNSSISTLTIEASSSDEVMRPTLTAIGFSNLTSGRLVVSGLTVPPTGVTVVSSAGGSDTAQVAVTANIKPVARNDTALTNKNTAAVINVLANDMAISGTLDPTTVTIVTPAGHGTTSVDPVTGDVTYTPNLDFAGKDSFTYTVKDSFAQVSNVATVTINVIGSEVLTVTKAVFTRKSKLWQIKGKSTVKAPGNIVTLYVGPDATGAVIGTAGVNSLGGWSFSKRNSPVDPGIATSITAKSALGTVLTFPLTIR